MHFHPPQDCVQRQANSARSGPSPQAPALGVCEAVPHFTAGLRPAANKPAPRSGMPSPALRPGSGARRLRSGASHFTAGPSSGMPAAPVPALRRRLRAFGVYRSGASHFTAGLRPAASQQRPVPALRRRLRALGVCEAALRISPRTASSGETTPAHPGFNTWV